MSKRELQKISREIKQIKESLGKTSSNNYQDEYYSGEDASPMSNDEIIGKFLFGKVQDIGKHTPNRKPFHYLRGSSMYGAGAVYKGIPNTAIDSINLFFSHGSKLQVTLELEYGDSVKNTFNVDMRQIMSKREDKKLSSNILKFLQEYYTYDPDGYLDDEDVPTFYSDEGPRRRYSSKRRASTRRRG